MSEIKGRSIKGRPIIWEQAPCRPDGEITAEGQEEGKGGSCYCEKNPDGCCVDGFGVIIPPTLKAKWAALSDEELEPLLKEYG